MNSCSKHQDDCGCVQKKPVDEERKLSSVGESAVALFADPLLIQEFRLSPHVFRVAAKRA